MTKILTENGRKGNEESQRIWREREEVKKEEKRILLFQEKSSKEEYWSSYSVKDSRGHIRSTFFLSCALLKRSIVFVANVEPANLTEQKK